MEKNQKHKDILFHQIIPGTKTFIEITPKFSEQIPETILSWDSSGNLVWSNLLPFPEIPECPEIPDFDVIIDDKIKSTNIFYKDGRIGISRPPMHSYKFDIAVPENTLMTAFHVGDGKYGFSMGNGTSKGFIPEIIGMGSDENDAGLYFLGKSGNNKKSNIPLIIMDGRNASNTALINRPIFGVTSGNYNEYDFLIDPRGRVGIGKIPEIYKVEIKGSIQAEDFIVDDLSIKALIDIIGEQQQEIDRLNEKVDLFIEQQINTK